MTRKRKKRYFRIVGVALAAMALSAPVAQARVDVGTSAPNTGPLYVPGVTDFPQGDTQINARKLRHDPVSPTTLGAAEPAREAASTGGFDWSDFAIGAAAGMAAAAIAVGAILLMGRPALGGRRRSAATVA
jgi:hypothetical protein